MRSRPTLTLAALLAVAIAACGTGSPSVVPSLVSSAALTQTPGPSGGATATITVEAGVEADGPGASVSEALANADVGSQLVNGIMLKEVGGSVWLCEALSSSPPKCAEPRLLVKNLAQGDQTFVGEGVREVDGVRWVENAQLFGIVRP